MTNEEWYDAEIAPKLMELCKACQERGIPFMSVVEYSPGERSRTMFIPESAGLEMVMIQHCAKTAPNIDGYIIGLARYAREKGIDTSASFVMQKLTGQPTGES